MKGKWPFLLLVVLGVALDLGTKELAFHYTRPEISRRLDLRIEVIRTGGFTLDWHRVENSGGMFGVGQGHGGVLRYFRLVALGVVAVFWLRARAAQRLLLFSLSLILAGAFGNLYDSFFNRGLVRDFIEVRLLFMPRSLFGQLFDPWPTFNVADSLILVGAVLLVIQLLWSPRPHAGSEAAAGGPAAR
ncbi:MAG: signal peptidase II [Planctomycetes bacterium]|nr:signal peptidase II [Planctomycetota bacterium]